MEVQMYGSMDVWECRCTVHMYMYVSMDAWEYGGMNV